MKWTIALVWVLYASGLSAQCDTMQMDRVRIEIRTDNFPFETTWEIRNSFNTVLASGGPFNRQNQLFTDSLCVSKSECIAVIIKDRDGDGLCCQHGDGSFRIFKNNQLVAHGGAFGRKAVTYLNCRAGAVCQQAIPIQPPDTFGTTAADNWYVFTPTAPGYYNISTCGLDNDCHTAIGIYDNCDNTTFEFSNAGTIFYNDNACGNLAELRAPLTAGKQYLLRIAGRCDPDTLHWAIRYGGEVTGCMDSFACNFNPLATQDSGDCRYQGDPECPQGPDLRIGKETLEASMYRDIINNPDPCLREEGCLQGYGERTVIRFDTKIENVGSQDFYVGLHPDDVNDESTTWEFDKCHQHWHYEGYAEYLLFAENGEALPASFKNGFCVLDYDCPSDVTAKYSCENQGITAGCSDTYERHLPCQWLDITQVAPGLYTLAVRINWNQAPDALGRYETGYANNWAQVCIEIFRDSATNYTGYVIVDDCPAYIDCKGRVNGNARFDCKGICDGEALTGDLDENGIRNHLDVLQYINNSLTGHLPPASCSDLTDDGEINIWDASLLLDCILHEGAPPQPGHSHTPCEFPFSIHNPYDTLAFRIERVDEVAQYFDIYIYTPYGNISAFELPVSGIKIASVQSLAADYQVDLSYSERKVVGISFVEDKFKKTDSWQPFLRVFYDPIGEDEICISDTAVVVSDRYERVLPIYGGCQEISTVATTYILSNGHRAEVIPNPVGSIAEVVTDIPLDEIFEFEIRTVAGRLIYRRDKPQKEDLIFYTGDWLPGIYFYKLHTEYKVLPGRFIVH